MLIIHEDRKHYRIVKNWQSILLTWIIGISLLGLAWTWFMTPIEFRNNIFPKIAQIQTDTVKNNNELNYAIKLLKLDLCSQNPTYNILECQKLVIEFHGGEIN